MATKRKKLDLKNWVVLAIGLVSLSLTPSVNEIATSIARSSCPLNFDGSCPFSYEFTANIQSAYFAIAWGIIAAVISIAGIIILVPSRKM